MVNIYMLKAFEGDFIWLNYGEKGKEHHILIDGGVKECGDKYAEVIERIAERNQTIEAIILTHIDCDHIAGACEGIAKVKSEILQKAVKRIIFNASEEIHREIEVKNTSGGYGVKEGIQFWEILEKKGIKEKLKNNVISGQIITLEGGANLKIISPGEKQLDDLFKKWEKYEQDHSPVGYTSNAEQLNQNLVDLKAVSMGTDGSVNNASSIAFLFEYEDVKGAFLADAKPSVCVEGMKKFNIKNPYIVDFIKISHHGSMTNTNSKLLKWLCTKSYLISTDGNSKKVPAKAVIARLLRNCEEEEKERICLYCNYDWWETVYCDKYFTKNDRETYIDSQILRVHLLEENGICLKDGLKIYGKI